MFFYNNPYLTSMRFGGVPALPTYQGDDGSSEVDNQSEEKLYTDHDGIYDYKVVDGVWYTQKKGSGEEWTSLEGNEEAINKLNTQYPDAINIPDESEEQDSTDITDITEEAEDEDDANAKIDAYTKFQNPDQATILSGIGDNPFLELVDAIGRGVKSFKSENYYDPGTKSDYMKFTVRNPTGEDLYYDKEDYFRMGYNPGKYLKDEEQVQEEEMMNFLEQRRENRPDMYGKVKDFDMDLFNLTGRGKTYNRRGPGQGDLLEEKYQDAEYLGYTQRPDGSSVPYDYLVTGPGNIQLDGVDGIFVDKDFDKGSRPTGVDDSPEWQRSMKNPMNQPVQIPPREVQPIPTNISQPELNPVQVPVITPTNSEMDYEPGQEDLPPMPSDLARYGGGLTKYQSLGEFGAPTQGTIQPTFSGYSLSGNQSTPFFTSSPTLNNPAGFLNQNVLFSQSTDDTYTPMSNARLYAMNQSVNRSLDEFKAFTADMNKRLENPSLMMNQVNTNPLQTPNVSFEPSEEFLQAQDMMDYNIAEREGRITSDGQVLMSSEQMQDMFDQTSANLQSQVDAMPEYTGTQENLDRYDRSMELGFDGDLAAMDAYDAAEAEEAQMRSDRADLIDATSERPGFGTRAYNTMLRVADSKPVQTYSKVSDMLIDVAKPITKIARAANERRQRANIMNNAFLADNMFAATEADVTGQKGNYDPNTGLFRPDDKVVVGTTQSAQFGGAFYKPGGEIEIDMNTYKQLVAAGADIQIV